MEADELDWIDPAPPLVGGAEAGAAEPDRHSAHGFLYVPDLSSRTGWSAHRIPERQDRQDRRPIGFRR